MSHTQHAILFSLCMAIASASIWLPLPITGKVCTVITSSFDPIKVDIKLPQVKGEIEGDNFHIIITELVSENVVEEVYVSPNSTYRHSYDLTNNMLHELCISYPSQRDLSGHPPLYVGYDDYEDFESLIGQVEIPPELSKEENMQKVYSQAHRLNEISKTVATHQDRQRRLEDEIVNSDWHKSHRVLTLGFIEILVIVLSGVYQIFALRKFLIEKNLY